MLNRSRIANTSIYAREAMSDLRRMAEICGKRFKSLQWHWSGRRLSLSREARELTGIAFMMRVAAYDR